MSEFMPDIPYREKKEIPDIFGPEKKIKLDPKILEKLDVKIRIEMSSMLPENGGTWSGEKGDSEWIPDDDVVPGDRRGTNPDRKTWKE